MSKILQTLNLLRHHFSTVSWLQLGIGSTVTLGTSFIVIKSTLNSWFHVKQSQKKLQDSKIFPKPSNTDKLFATLFGGIGLVSAWMSLCSSQCLYQIIHSPKIGNNTALTITVYVFMFWCTYLPILSFCNLNLAYEIMNPLLLKNDDNVDVSVVDVTD